MGQECLEGIACRDSLISSEAERLGLDRKYACNPDDPWCGSPYKSKLAADLWEKCYNPQSLNLVRHQGLPKLLSCIPNLKARERVDKFESGLMLATKASNIGGILSLNQEKLRAWRTKYGIRNHCWLLIHQESRDHLQDRLSEKTKDSRFLSVLRAVGLRTVFITPGYSVYDDGTMCPVRQVLNIRRSLREAAWANQNGFPAVPTIGWNSHRSTDLEYLASWATKQGEFLTTLAVNAQTGTNSDALTTKLAEGIVEIERLSSRQFQWIVFGGRRRIEILSGFIPRHRLVQICRSENFHIPSGMRIETAPIDLPLLKLATKKTRPA